MISRALQARLLPGERGEGRAEGRVRRGACGGGGSGALAVGLRRQAGGRGSGQRPRRSKRPRDALAGLAGLSARRGHQRHEVLRQCARLRLRGRVWHLSTL